MIPFDLQCAAQNNSCSKPSCHAPWNCINKDTWRKLHWTAGGAAARKLRLNWPHCRPGTWQEVLSTEDESQRLARVEGYNNYVDIVESQLGREIAALQEHSTEFFQASSFLEVSLSLRSRAFL